MPKLRLIFIFSLVILAALVGLTAFYTLTKGLKYSEVFREQLLQTEDGYVIEFQIRNHEGEDKNYIINVLIDSKLYSEDVLIPDGSMFAHVHHIYPDRMNEGKVSVVIYKEGEDAPFEQITYYIASD